MVVSSLQFETVIKHLRDSATVKLRTAEVCGTSILAAADLIGTAFITGHKLLLCGNGGSAADCQHTAAEMTSRLSGDFARPGLPAIALTTDSSFLTAYANDFDFEGVFARQVQAVGKPGDVLLGISTSGRSKNVIRAIHTARRRVMKVVLLTGAQLADAALEEAEDCIVNMVDVAICVPSDNTQFIQEAHIAVEHILCHLVERAVFGEHGMADWDLGN